MSEMNKKTVCPSCGAEVPVNESKSLKKLCRILRGVLEDDQGDWEEKETEVPSDPVDVLQDVRVAPTALTLTLADRMKKLFSHKLLNRIIVAVLSIAMLALAFAPFVSYRIVANDVTYDLEYSGADNLQMTATSAYLLGEPFSMTQERGEIVSEEGLATQTMLTAASVKMGVNLTVIIATVCYVVYVLLCLVMVLCALKDLISEFFAAKKNRTRTRKYAADGILCFLLCFFPVLAFAMRQACDVSVANAVLFDKRVFVGTELSWGAIVSLAVVAIGALFVCLAHSFGTLRLHGRYFDRARVKHLISVLLVIGLLISLFLPFVEIKLWDADTETEQTAAVTQWEIREITRNERTVYQKSGATATTAYEAIVAQGEELPEEAGEEFVNTVFMTSMMSSIRMIYTVIEIVTLLVALFGGLLLWSLLRRGFFGVKRLRRVNFFKFLTMLTVMVALILAIIVQELLAIALPSALVYSVDFKLGAGILAMIILSVLAVALRLSARKEVKYVDEEYDNADVSYSPYVLKKKN